MIRVASYCRVSTDSDDQVNSLESQRRYFRTYIAQHPDWQLHEVYADEGITGTSTKKRAQFNRMVADAYEGKFQLIITKEVSRFSRNILDTIAYTRELKAIGVGVVFMLDGIDTRKPDAEMYLSIMASLAQEESRKTSSRVVWGQTRQMERGVVFGRSMLGYDVKDGRISVNPEGAELVRLIFHKYALEQCSISQIARYLTREGICTYSGGAVWRANTVARILNNEKYVGDLVQKKTYTPDYLTHEKRRNTGQVPLIILRNHHAPIITREVWDRTQERLRRNNKRGAEEDGHSSRYVFSGKIRCGECGAAFVARYKTLADGTKVRRWRCGRAERDGASVCAVGKLVRDDDAMRMLRCATGSVAIDTEALVRNVMALIPEGSDGGREGTCHDAARIRRKKELLLDRFLDGTVTKEDLQAMNRKYDRQLEALRQRLAKRGAGEGSGGLREELAALAGFETESDVLCRTLLDRLTVFADRHMELRLNGMPHIFRFT